MVVASGSDANHAGVLDAWKRPDALHQLRVERDNLVGGVVRRCRKLHAHRQQGIGIEAKVDAPQLREAAHHQPSPDHQHDGKRDLDGHEGAAEPLTPAADGRLLAAFAEPVDEIDVERTKRGRQTEEQCGHDAEDQRKQRRRRDPASPAPVAAGSSGQPSSAREALRRRARDRGSLRQQRAPHFR